MAPLVDQIRQGAGAPSGLELPGVGALTSCRCPQPCGALVTFPRAETIFCPVCVEQVFEPGETAEGEPVVTAYAAPNGTGGTDAHRQELPARTASPRSADDGLDAPSEFTGFLQVSSNDPEQRHLRLPIKLELQAPLLVIEPSFIDVEIARGGQASATLTLRNGGEAPLTLRNLEAVDAAGRPLLWATPALAAAAGVPSDEQTDRQTDTQTHRQTHSGAENAVLAPGDALPITVRFHSEVGGEHAGLLRLVRLTRTCSLATHFLIQI